VRLKIRGAIVDAIAWRAKGASTGGVAPSVFRGTAEAQPDARRFGKLAAGLSGSGACGNAIERTQAGEHSVNTAAFFEIDLFLLFLPDSSDCQQMITCNGRSLT
jgi:hypothetical protein